MTAYKTALYAAIDAYHASDAVMPHQAYECFTAHLAVFKALEKNMGFSEVQAQVASRLFAWWQQKLALPTTFEHIEQTLVLDRKAA